MSRRDVSLYVVDILMAVNKLRRYTANFSNAIDFLHSELEWDATIRELQLIGDAINILIKEGVLDQRYRRIVDFRNQIVHAYFGIDAEIVWSVAEKKVPALEQDLLETCRNSSISLKKAIDCAIEENLFNEKLTEYLKRLLIEMKTD